MIDLRLRRRTAVGAVPRDGREIRRKAMVPQNQIGFVRKIPFLF
jgi:hypothetical protein